MILLHSHSLLLNKLKYIFERYYEGYQNAPQAQLASPLLVIYPQSSLVHSIMQAPHYQILQPLNQFLRKVKLFQQALQFLPQSAWVLHFVHFFLLCNGVLMKALKKVQVLLNHYPLLHLKIIVNQASDVMIFFI